MGPIHAHVLELAGLGLAIPARRAHGLQRREDVVDPLLVGCVLRAARGRNDCSGNRLPQLLLPLFGEVEASLPLLLLLEPELLVPLPLSPLDRLLDQGIVGLGRRCSLRTVVSIHMQVR